ncbi:MAG: glycosyltransferase [Acidimicrobiales bacterium]
MDSLAVLSMHTSPLAQPGSGDGGGMNVYVRELSAALARVGVRCEVFTRTERPGQPRSVSVEPGLVVHHVPAGPASAVAKERLPDLVDEWTCNVSDRLQALADGGRPVDAIHANYWLSGLAGHRLKHQLDVPLISTFHTLDRVKAEASPEELSVAEPARRALAEAEIVGCSDAVLASCLVEAEQLVAIYGADPDRTLIVPPGVDHAFFAPGDQQQARRAIGLPTSDPLVCFVGRIQPLKGVAVAIEALGHITSRGGRLAGTAMVVVGGPSGPHGAEELARARALVTSAGLAGRVHWVPPQRHEILSSYYRAADVCVVPSRSESFGLVALEAGACGVPVVAAAVGGLSTLVDDGHTGVLVDDHEDALAYAEALATILADPARARAMGGAAAQRAGAYTWASAARRLRARCRELTSRQLVACR